MEAKDDNLFEEKVFVAQPLGTTKVLTENMTVNVDAI